MEEALRMDHGSRRWTHGTCITLDRIFIHFKDKSIVTCNASSKNIHKFIRAKARILVNRIHFYIYPDLTLAKRPEAHETVN
jgi:hypothetical protein